MDAAIMAVPPVAGRLTVAQRAMAATEPEHADRRRAEAPKDDTPAGGRHAAEVNVSLTSRGPRREGRGADGATRRAARPGATRRAGAARTAVVSPSQTRATSLRAWQEAQQQRHGQRQGQHPGHLGAPGHGAQHQSRATRGSRGATPPRTARAPSAGAALLAKARGGRKRAAAAGARDEGEARTVDPRVQTTAISCDNRCRRWHRLR